MACSHMENILKSMKSAPSLLALLLFVQFTSSLNPCSNCNFDNGSCFKAVPFDCSKFIECDLSLNPIMKSCPAGLFWDLIQNTCDHPHKALCMDDPCSQTDKTVVSYAYQGSCRDYWTCVNFVSEPRCCPRDHSFNGKRCVPDAKCNVTCQTQIEIIPTTPAINATTTTPKPCIYESHPKDPTIYQQTVHGRLFLTRCPSETIFSYEHCTCIIAIDGQPVERCSPFLNITFDEGYIIDESTLKNTIMMTGNVKVERKKFVKLSTESNAVAAGMVARFDGRSRLIIFGLQSNDFLNKLTISFKFINSRPQVPGTVLVSNCYDSRNSLVSFEMTFASKDQLAIKAGSFKKSVTMLVKFTPSKWNQVTCKYNGNTLATTISSNTGSSSDSKVLKGNFKMTHGSFKLGGGCDKPMFNGYLDDILVYKCIPQ